MTLAFMAGANATLRPAPHSASVAPLMAVQASVGCGWTCCQPMALLVHASLHSTVDPDPNNDPNLTDIVWQAAQPSNGNIVAPIRFRVQYCEAPYSSTGCRWYSGFVQISNNAPPVIVQQAGTAAWPTPGECGQVLDPPFPSASAIVSYAFWTNPNPVSQEDTVCGTDAVVIDPASQSCASFVDTDHLLWIARTANNPSGTILCFKQIEVWVDGPQADNSSLLVQHNFDQITQSPCTDIDRYTLVSTPKQRVARSGFKPYAETDPVCTAARIVDNFPGGTEADVCVMAIFKPIP